MSVSKDFCAKPQLMWLLGVGAIDLFLLIYMFKYNLIHYKDTLFINDQITLVLFPMIMSG